MNRVSLLLALTAAAACSAPPSPPAAAPSVASPAASAPRVNAELLVSTAWLADHLQDPGVVVLHVARERAAYDAGHLPGARFLPLGAIVTERDGLPNELPGVAQLDSVFESVGVSDDVRVVLYGELGGLAAGRAFFTLDYLGHLRVALLDGGLEAWQAEGRALATGATPTPARGQFTPRPQSERLVTAAWVREHADDAGMVLIDARPPAEYRGTEPGAGVARPGHIPGGQNIFWRSALVSAEQPLLREVEELRELYRAAGARPGTTVVTYCRTGVQASHAYFVARYLGFDTRMYDGSFIDWSRRPELPVAR